MVAPRLLLLGLRRAVLPAVRRSGLEAYALVGADHSGSKPDELRDMRRVDLHGGSDIISRTALDMLGDGGPVVVLALAERTVLAAARLRTELGAAGNSEETALRCADKGEMKRAMNAAGVPVARWKALAPGQDARALLAELEAPLVLKPRRDSGGRGQIVVRELAELEEALAGLDFARLGWLAESWIEGVEMSVESFVSAGQVRFWNPTEYMVPRHANILPAKLDDATRSAVEAFNNRVLAAAGVDRGITHLELFRTEQGLVLGELAIRPPGGRLMPLLQKAWGFDPWAAMLALELGQAFDFPGEPRCAAGVWVLHPGAGTLQAIQGLEAARAVPHVTRVTISAEVGDRIGYRFGSGQDLGSIRAHGPDRDSVATALRNARNELVFRLEA